MLEEQAAFARITAIQQAEAAERRRKEAEEWKIRQQRLIEQAEAAKKKAAEE